MIHSERMGMKKNKQGEKMSYAVSINSSGQATIPKAVREFLGVVPGENRLIFDFVGGKVVLKREPSRREMLEASMKKIWAMNEKEEHEHPEVREAKEKYKGMTFNEVRDAYDATPEGREEFKEKYGFYPVA
jgi:bifunctional DNA-binding transcriptional regulator/antitoxin component of YhaV-PrlF toxin-antitoxin module